MNDLNNCPKELETKEDVKVSVVDPSSIPELTKPEEEQEHPTRTRWRRRSCAPRNSNCARSQRPL